MTGSLLTTRKMLIDWILKDDWPGLVGEEMDRFAILADPDRLINQAPNVGSKCFKTLIDVDQLKGDKETK